MFLSRCFINSRDECVGYCFIGDFAESDVAIHTPNSAKLPCETKDQRGHASIYETSELCLYHFFSACAPIRDCDVFRDVKPI